jgi:triosephosphate isomerase|tara:strand:- start:23525 stop:24283 length:759 start_codon:yes stop_codon:yes gene_type:complete
MRRKLVIGNWKMHGSNSQVQELLGSLKIGLDDADNVEVGVCPTTLHLASASETLVGSQIKLGAQNANAQTSGAFTGEVAAAMLLEYGVSYCLVGHSERRGMFLEGDAQVAEKFAAVQKAGLTPVLCVGESLAQREQESTEQVILAQVDAVLDKVGVQAFANAVLAYEPIWAIGTGKTATPSQAQAVHELIRQHVAARDVSVAKNLRIIYGGSVKSSNAADLFGQADIDGGLVGGASLSAEEFIVICKSADSK